MGAPRRRRLTFSAAVGSLATALLVGLGGCGSANHIHLGSPPAPTTTVDPSADGGQAAAILAAYRGSLADFNKVSTTAPLNPDDPQLADHMSGKELSQVMSAFRGLVAHHEIDSGGITSLRADINQYNGTQAVVVSCEHDMSSILDAKTGQRIGNATNDTELVNDLAVLQDGRWKIAESNLVSPGCS